MFRQVRPQPQDITIYIDDRPCAARVGDLLANILLQEGMSAVHATPNGTPRGPYCMMGVCFDCMVRLEDGRFEQACQTYAEDGLRIYLPVSVVDESGQ